ncbi:MAG: acyltransferase [Prolixibacteraceae bacterium]|jgi:UDP-2-acetamido-3-amino-2,3-dideoxy-glucuronate N-acetyltransferase|nr:acetyltransferase [Prolixibacteraceae bacterium]
MKNNYIDPSSIVDQGVTIGHNTRIWHFCHIMKDVRIGNDSILGQNVMVAPNVNIGSNVKVQNNVSIYTGVEVCDHVFIGPSVVFTNVINPRSFIERKDEFLNTLLNEGCSIGANATIVCGVSIGCYAMVGAGAVVVKSIPPYALVVGNPSKQIGWVSKAGMRLDFDSNNHAVCPYSNETYLLENGSVYCNNDEK